MNVTSEEPGVGAGVLLRALEPLEGAYNRQELIGKSSFKRFRRIAFMHRARTDSFSLWMR